MFNLDLVTPEKKLVTGLEVEEVIVPGHRGQLDVMPGHAPLMTTLSVGPLKYRPKGSATFETVIVSWGYCEINPTGVIVLAETAESLEEIDRERAEVAAKKAKSMLEGPHLEPDQIEKFQRKLERALARIDASKETSH